MAGKAFFFMLTVTLAICCYQSSALTYPIIDTGLTDFSSDSAPIRAPLPGQAFYGQDANYNGIRPSYRDNGDGTVTDLVTGLMWTQALSNQMTYDNALITVKNLRIGGYSDWRIPRIKELYSLILFSGNVDGINAGNMMFIDTRYFNQPLGFPRQIDAQTLSSTRYTGLVYGNVTCLFGVNFIDGRIKCYETYMPRNFRFVRGPTTYGINNFTANADGTISDRATGLMWMKNDSGKAMDWSGALAYCENLVFGGYSDWRLPNVKELQSIVDYTRGPQTTRSPAISPLFQMTMIREPDGTYDYPYFWSGTTHHDGFMPQYAAYMIFGQGWGKPTGSVKLVDVHGAGAQRSDPKSALGQTYPQYMGPQGDMRIVYNYARCVRTI